MMGSSHDEIERDYMNFIDALSYFGGLTDLIAIFIAFLYSKYLDSRYEQDRIHKACMITGKLG